MSETVPPNSPPASPQSTDMASARLDGPPPGQTEDFAGNVTGSTVEADAPPAIQGCEILAVLGRGGMGVVYKARQTRLNRLVALKMILAGEHAGPEARLRFMTEAEAIAKIQHPAVV